MDGCVGGVTKGRFFWYARGPSKHASFVVLGWKKKWDVHRGSSGHEKWKSEIIFYSIFFVPCKKSWVTVTKFTKFNYIIIYQFFSNLVYLTMLDQKNYTGLNALNSLILYVFSCFISCPAKVLQRLQIKDGWGERMYKKVKILGVRF